MTYLAPPHDEPPPFLGSWRNVYLMVIIYLVGVIAVLSLVSIRWAV